MRVYAVDLGTTNTKVALFDERLRRLAVAAEPAALDRDGDRVELSPAALLQSVLRLIARCATDGGDTASHDAVIALTGQAESLVLVDRHGDDVRPALSWLDDRATQEAAELAARFGDEAFRVTGQPASSSTWPAAKLRWLGRHEPRSLERAASVLMLKDDLARRLTGTAVGERTTRGFTYLYDVLAGTPWAAMLDAVSVEASALPPVVAAGADIGQVTAAIADRLPPAASYRVNAGALDHFCAMVGTGSYAPGIVSESAGTVLSLSVLTQDWRFDRAHRASFHAGIGEGDVVLFNGVDSGGAALEWFRRESLDGMDFASLEAGLVARGARDAPIFLPYLTGVNPPDYLPDARGAFLDLVLGHDRFDLAFAVEEGVAHLLRRNVEALGSVQQITSTGGGAASRFWSQLKADVCGVDVVVPDEQEATCRGAAVLALVAAGELADLHDADALEPGGTVRCSAHRTSDHEARYRRFDRFIDLLFRD